ncbi:MAG: hypothetical protein KF779_09135 [Hyphomonadaceae bacterium]|nr:hypothetical protein [Hyphomonadaceae bacterium]
MRMAMTLRFRSTSTPATDIWWAVAILKICSVIRMGDHFFGRLLFVVIVKPMFTLRGPHRPRGTQAKPKKSHIDDFKSDTELLKKRIDFKSIEGLSILPGR